MLADWQRPVLLWAAASVCTLNFGEQYCCACLAVNFRGVGKIIAKCLNSWRGFKGINCASCHDNKKSESMLSEYAFSSLSTGYPITLGESSPPPSFRNLFLCAHLCFCFKLFILMGCITVSSENKEPWVANLDWCGVCCALALAVSCFPAHRFHPIPSLFPMLCFFCSVPLVLGTTGLQ